MIQPGGGSAAPWPDPGSASACGARVSGQPRAGRRYGLSRAICGNVNRICISNRLCSDRGRRRRAGRSHAVRVTSCHCTTKRRCLALDAPRDVSLSCERLPRLNRDATCTDLSRDAMQMRDAHSVRQASVMFCSIFRVCVPLSGFRNLWSSALKARVASAPAHGPCAAVRDA